MVMVQSPEAVVLQYHCVYVVYECMLYARIIKASKLNPVHNSTLHRLIELIATEP